MYDYNFYEQMDSLMVNTRAVCYSTIRVDAANQTGGIHLVLYPDRA